MQKLALSTIIMVVMMSCTMEVDLLSIDSTFKIPKGKHKSGYRFRSFKGDHLSFQAVFNASAIYTLGERRKQKALNKLLGFSSCNTHHHKNSARVTWRWFEDELQIFAYVYAREELHLKYICSVPLHENIKFDILKYNNGYGFWVNDNYAEILTPSICADSKDYILWPYFGGDEPAPHDIEIKLYM